MKRIQSDFSARDFAAWAKNMSLAIPLLKLTFLIVMISYAGLCAR